MGKLTILDKIRGWWYHLEYIMAKRWLDREFGEHEYWGEVISDLFNSEDKKKEI